MQDFRFRLRGRRCSGAELVCCWRCRDIRGMRRLPVLRHPWSELLVVWYLKSRTTRQPWHNTAAISKGARPIPLLERLTVRLLLLLLGLLLSLLLLLLLG